MANNNPYHNDRCKQKWPTSTTHKATHPLLRCWINRRGYPEQVDILLSCDERVYDPKKCSDGKARFFTIITCHQSILRALDFLIAREKHICLLGGLSSIITTRLQSKLGLVCSARGAFLAEAAAMVVMVVVFLQRACEI
jgi:hypothetical protein